MPRSYKVLLIEDDLQIIDLYTLAFQKAGFTVKTAKTADETYQVLKDFTPDIIFIDIMLPDVLGTHIYNELRENPQYKCQNVKMYYLSNVPEDALDKIPGYNEADGFIVKADTVPSDLIKVVESAQLSE